MHTNHSVEPIAIIGLGCRFPGGANDWRSFWGLLESGTDAVSETPAERWNVQKFYASNVARPGKTQSKWGGYVSSIESFDPHLFGISPREAASMDPQQRMLLEAAFRALEDAGQPLEQVAGQAVSVFVGISSFDYAVASLSFRDRGVVDAYSNTGGSSSIAANRISYCFDLRGPSVAIDTACSSSLVAVHLACESLWRGEAHMALAGGVNALLMPDFYVAFSQLGVLSPDGRCKSFDARANGYVRSEGAGMAMLKPLSAALRDKDPIYAVIRATALNQDGRTPGMTVPSQAAQQQLILAACRKAEIQPSRIQYVEAHGTGTPVGDPIEAAAIGAVVGAARRATEPCAIGSVKTNIGHLEAGAGIASLMKVALSLHHRRIPAHLHFKHPNPNIDLAALHLRVVTETCDWESDQPRLAGINGFGYGGANAHIILEQAPEAAACVTVPQVAVSQTLRTKAASQGANGRQPSQLQESDWKAGKVETLPFAAPVLLPLSARSQSALLAIAKHYAEWLERHGSSLPLAEVAGYLAHRRSHHDYRATATATNLTEMLVELKTIAATSPDEFTEDFSSSKLARGAAFVCSGQGPQWWAMGRGLLKYSPAFRSVIKRCDIEFSRYGDWSLLKELSRGEADSRMHQTSLAQPSIFAIQVALAAVWESWGVKPTAIVGHSVGEIAAAYLSGGLSWEDAACVAFHRGRSMDLASSHGAMIAVGLSANEVPAWLNGIEAEVAIAAINGPSSVTISGAAVAIEQLATRLEQAGVFCRRLAVEYAFHSPQMEPVRDELLRALERIQPQRTHTPMISTVTGKLIEGTELGADYWWHNVRQSVRFSEAMACLADLGYGVVIEVGPHPVLAYSINECFQAAGCSVRSIPSLNRQQDDLQCITKSLGSLYSLGFNINWSGFYNHPTRRVDLPTYPFQLRRCWSESLESQMSRLSGEAHPLLGTSVLAPTPQWEQRIDLKLQSYLADHSVRGSAIYPAAAVIETALAAVQQTRRADASERLAASSAAETNTAEEPSPIHLQRVRLHHPCVLGDDRPQWIQTGHDAERRQLRMAFRPCQEQPWSSLATIDISTQPAPERELLQADFQSRVDALHHSASEEFDSQRLYAHCRRIGLQYGSGFQGVVRGARVSGAAVVEIQLPDDGLKDDDRVDDYCVHPALLDSCFHGMIAADPDFDHTVDGLYLPSEIRQVIWYRRPSTHRVTALVSCPYKSKHLMRCDLDIFDADGKLCMCLRGFESRRVSGGTTAETTEDLVYSYSWIEQSLGSAEPLEPGGMPSRIVFMDEGGIGRELNERLRQRGERVVEIYREDSHVPQAVSHSFYQAATSAAGSFREALNAAVSDLGGAVDSVVYLWGLDAPATDDLSTASLEESTELSTLGPLYLVQAWEQLTPARTADLTIVTAGAQSPDGMPERTQVAQAPLIGFGRVVASETASLRCKLVDLPSATAARDIDCLASEMIVGDEEDEVMWRNGSRWVHRFGPLCCKPASVDAVRELACQLRVGGSAGIEELHYQTKPALPLAEGEVEIEVLASGLNFSDVMKALDLYPGLPDGPIDLGAECSGRVSRVGPGCDWHVGDEVISIAPGSFATQTIVRQELVARKPRNLTHQQAAAIPVAFLTASYALNECARLRTGDSILIHAASGGVGLAAMQLAKLAGLRILATAGSDEKRKFVRDAGACCAMDSRSLAFVLETWAATDGQGVDAVLNSLPGEAIAAGLSILKTGGRFLEIGKRDIYNDAALGLFPFRNNLSLFAIDLDQLFKEQPQRMGNMLRRIVERFEQGELKPLPVQAFPAEQTRAAYRFMQQGKHIGKVVVEYQQRPSDIRPGATPELHFDSQGTFWLAGGLGGFGLEIARWLAERGVRSLVLSGRSQQPSPAAQSLIAQLEQAGVQVTLLPADITQPAEVRRVLDTIAKRLPPLRGIVHAAMVLEDKLIADLDSSTLQRVLRPKVLGGWNLHRETLDLELDYFILFSSLSSVFGHAGQANYAAANALLDSLAFERRAQGLPATVINWGHLGEVGYLAEREALGQRLERQGVLSFTVKQATDCLEYALHHRELQMSVLRIDWSLWRGLGLTNRVSPRFAHLLQSSIESDVLAGGSLPSADSLRTMTPARRSEVVEQLLRAKAGNLLGIAPAQIPADRALLEQGLDSLMAVEMRNWIESQLTVNLPISALMRSESLSHIVKLLCAALDETQETNETRETITESSAAEQTGEVSQAEASELLSQLPNLDADEVTQLLSQMLREK